MIKLIAVFALCFVVAAYIHPYAALGVAVALSLGSK
jgi:hypothetical protein